MAETLTVEDLATQKSTTVVSGTAVDGTGQFLSRTYGNGVTRSIEWNTVTRTPKVIAASFQVGETTEVLQSDVLARDVVGRVTSIVDGSTDVVSGSRQCYAYDGFNRLRAAWTTDDPCGEVPEEPSTSWLVGDPASAAYAASYATSWDYSDSGKIESIVNLAADGSRVTSAYTYPTSGPVHAVSEVDRAILVEGFSSGTYAAGSELWVSAWVEAGDDGSASTGLISTSDGVLWLQGAIDPAADAVVSRVLDVSGVESGSLEVGFAAAGQELEAGDVVTVTVIPDDTPASALTGTVIGTDLTVAVSPDWEEDPFWVAIDLESILPAGEIEIQIGVTAGVEDGDGTTREKVLVTGVELTTAGVGEYGYDEAGRMETRTVDDGAGDVTTAFTWDVSSNLVKTVETGGDTFLYLYDGTGQRVLKVNTTEETATAYFGSTEVTDADTSVNADLVAHPNALEGTGFVTGTRFYTFGGATVAVRQGNAVFDDSLSLLLGDQQGSASILLPVHLDATTKAMLPATSADADNATRNDYLPYGATRGGSDLDLDHGWLNQVTDESDTGLIYLNARYYDPVLSRFLSPDPLMNPTDPRTLDPYRYADNNPILFQDSSGLCSGLSGSALRTCEIGGGFGQKYAEEYRAEEERKKQAAYNDARSGRYDQVGIASRKTAEIINANKDSLPQALIELGSFDNKDITVYMPNRGGLPFNSMQAKAATDLPSYLVYAFQNRAGGPWDLKGPIARELDLAGRSHYLQSASHPGEYLYYDTFGNVHLGFISAKAGLSLKEVLELSRLPGAGHQSPADDLATEMGYELYERVNGREVTANDICTLIDDYWEELRALGNVRNFR